MEGIEMAGHWIKWEKGLTKKPEVMRIARALGISTYEAAASCMLVWEWADDVTTDGLVVGVTLEDVNQAAGIPGIGEAMQAAGWLTGTATCIQFPNYNRHNGKTAKLRSETNRRMTRMREG
jgi:hypothetical protein